MINPYTLASTTDIRAKTKTKMMVYFLMILFVDLMIQIS